MLDLIFPRRCPVCHEPVKPSGALVCEACRDGFSFIDGPVCITCGKELNETEELYCRDCSRNASPVISQAALMNYDDTARRSMVMFKYKGRREYADYYAEELLRRRGDQIRSFGADVIVPVPVHVSKLYSRGYNQAEEIAVKLGERLGIPVIGHVLVRNRATGVQKALNAADRSRNLEGAFTAVKSLKGVGTVLLTDDIYTTGSTMRACAGTLLRAGAQRVFGAVICIGRN